jgi:hypothetical protein
VRQKKTEVWDAWHFALASMWQSYSHLFPRSLHVRSRPVKPSPDVVEAAAAFDERPIVFFRAWLSCDHVVLVPGELLMKWEEPGSKKPKRRALVPCYKCWVQAGGDVTETVCSFCGVPHVSAVPCMRPHLEQ